MIRRIGAWIVIAALLFLVAVYAVLAPRAIRKMRQGDTEWRGRWRALDRDKRTAIARAMRRGEAVNHPSDAELALRAVAQIARTREANHTLILFSYAAMAVVLIAGIAAGATIAIAGAVAALAFGAVTGAISHRRWLHLERSAHATRRVHAGAPPGRRPTANP